jgi:hypothetical protein
MAATWVARQAAVTHASGKSMIDVMNATGSSRIIRAYQLFMFNSNITAVTGVLTAFAIRRTSAASSGSTITPVAFDTASSALVAETTAGYGRTITPVATFRSFIFSNEEPTTTGAGANNLELLVPFAEWGRYGMDNTDLEPIVCRAGYGVDLQQSGTSAVASADVEIIFTDSAT